MALDTLGVVSGEFRKRLLLRNLANSDDAERITNLGVAIAIPQQYTSQQSDTRQFISTAISIKNLIDNTFKGNGGQSANVTTRAFVSQDYTYDQPYPLQAKNNEPLRDASEEIITDPPPQRSTYDVGGFDKQLNINTNNPATQNIPNTSQMKQKTSTDSKISDFYWKKDDAFVVEKDKKDLLSFTQSLLKNYKSDSIGKVIDQTQTRYQNPDGGEPYTKGSNVKDIDDPQKLAREFTVEKPYSTVGDLIRNESPYMMETGKSSLDDNGFARIAPKRGTINEASDLKNLMFSIENLAWGGKDGNGDTYISSLPCKEQGPNGGRLMWFPPYGITITDNSSVNWQSTPFVGRGEPIYTYNNTERSMTLQFKVIVDHPSILNAVKDQKRISIEQFFSATGGKLKDTISNKLGYYYKKMAPGHRDKLNVEMATSDGDVVTLGKIDSSFSLPKNIEPTTIYYSADTSTFVENVTGNTRNSSFSLTSFVDDLYSVFDKCNIILKGNSSDVYNVTCTGETNDNFFEGDNRITDFLNYISVALDDKAVSEGDLGKRVAIGDFITDAQANKSSDNPTGSGCDPMSVQSLNIKVQYNPTKDKTLKTSLSSTSVDELSPKSKIFLSRKTIPLCESEYFEAMEKGDKIALYKNLNERLDYFHPAFHSTTPEGFNGRLTFLLQCTRQGPSIQKTTDSPSNMAFGRPPVCVLKIGDFYHTKVVIDSVNISYDDNLWDLNPEGIGIQPMIATVDLNMKMVGGSSLVEPISKLQNALSYHFFANTEVYMGKDFTEDKIQDPVIIPKPDKKNDTTSPKIKGNTNKPDIVVTPDGLVLSVAFKEFSQSYCKAEYTINLSGHSGTHIVQSEVVSVDTLEVVQPLINTEFNVGDTSFVVNDETTSQVLGDFIKDKKYFIRAKVVDSTNKLWTLSPSFTYDGSSIC